MRLLLLAIFLSSFAHAAFAQSEPSVPAAGIEEIYLAKDDGNGKAGEQTSEFRVTDVPIYCVVLLDTREKATVKMNFVAVRVSGVKADTKVVTVSYTTKPGQNRVNFTGHPDGKWTAGKYRVDLFVDGKLAKKLEFDIKDVLSGGTPTTSASSFLPSSDNPKAKPPKPPKIRP